MIVSIDCQMKEKLLNTLHIFALSALVTAPLYDRLGGHGEFFSAHGTTGTDLVLFIVFISLVIPVLFAALPLIATVLSKKAARVVHAAVILAGSLLVAMPVAKGFFGGDIVIIIASVTFAIVFLILYYRLALLRLFLSLLSAAVIVVPLIFIMSPAISKIAFPDLPDAQKGAGTLSERASSETPVVLVIFDELPITSLMDESRSIDRVRYPGFAALADDAYWFRNATTVSLSTVYAVPAILTGKNPDGRKHLPTSSEYPENIYTLLAQSYGINAYECCFTIAPWELNIVKEEALSRRAASLLLDTRYLFLHLLLPPGAVETLPPVHLTWKDFGGMKMNIIKGQKGSNRRVENFLEFIESIESESSAPTLNVIHEVLPHSPWTHYPSGTSYGFYNNWITGMDDKYKWSDRKWPVIEGYRRYLLQLGFVDSLIARLVDRLKEKGLYDKSLIIVTADHGASFRSGDDFRFLTETNRVDTMPVPLLVKPPGQRSAVISDRNVETIDIVPTIAAVLGIKIPWDVDGSNMLDETIPERIEKLLFYGGDEAGDKTIFNARQSFPPTVDGKYRTLEEKLLLFGSGDKGEGSSIFRAGPYGSIVGKASAELVAGRSIIGCETGLGSESAVSSGIVAGTLSNVPLKEGIVNLALSRGGKVVAVTGAEAPSYGFEFLLPEKETVTGGGYEIFEIRGPAHNAVLHSTSTSVRTIERLGDTEFIVTRSKKGTGMSLKVEHGSMLGAVIDVEDKDGRYLILRGWAADVKNSTVPDEIVVFRDGSFIASAVTRYELPAGVVIEGAPDKPVFAVRLPSELGGVQLQREKLRLFAVLGNRATELNYPYSLWEDTGFTIGDGYLEGEGIKIPIKQGALVGILNSAVEEVEGSVRDAAFGGFAIDARLGKLPRKILLFGDGRLLYSARTSIYMNEIVTETGRDELLKSGFLLRVPFSVIEGKKELRLFALSEDGVASELSYYEGWQGRVSSAPTLP